MASYSKIWCTFIPHMCLKAKFHDTIFIIKLCPGGGGDQNITANEMLLKGPELYNTDGNLFWYTMLVFHYHRDLSVYSPHYPNRGIFSSLKVTHKRREERKLPRFQINYIGRDDAHHCSLMQHKLCQRNRQTLKQLGARTHDLAIR